MNATQAVMEKSSIGMIRPIQMLWALYVKDLRQLAPACLSLIVITHLISLIPWINYHVFAFGFPGYKMVYIFPTLLAYILYVNRRSGSAYLQKSLPISPGLSLMTVYMALVTYVWVYVIIIAGSDALTHVLARHESYNEYLARFNEEISIWQLFKRTFLRNLRPSSSGKAISLYAGIVCLAAGTMRSAVGRFRYWAGFLGVITLMFGIFALFERFDIRWSYAFGRYTPVLLGVTFAAIGAFFYHHYGEV